MEKFDVVVIGAGPGGYPAAIRAAQLGARTAIVEREALGGTCLNWGCIPSKALIASAELYARMRHAAEMGVRAEVVTFDWPAMVRRKDGVVAKLQTGVKQLLSGNGVKTFTGTASFEGRNRIAIQSADARLPATVVESSKTIIATGSTSAVPGLLPRHERVLESRAFLDLPKPPASVVIMGGGIIGCEFAGLLANLGVAVTVVEMLDDILVMLDADVRRAVRVHLEKLGARVLTGNKLENVSVTERGVQGSVGGTTVEGELLLVAVGRKPVTDGLRLEKAGLSTTAHGTIEVDAFGQTKTATIYAIGDVTDAPQLAHVATSMGLVAAEHACGKGRRRNETVIPCCIFTSPEVGAVGLDEQQASQQGKKILVGKFPFSSLGKALAVGEAGGFVKWIVDAETDRLLGAAAVGTHATDLIAEAAVAIRAELTAGDLGQTIHAHPTLSEAWMEAAHAVHGTCTHAAPRRNVS